MTDNKRHGFITGAFVLVAAMVVVKVIGALFKLPLTDLLGGDGMGYFSTAYSLFNPISAVAITGLPVAVARVVAENRAKRNYKNIKKLFSITAVLFLVIGIVGFFLILAFSGVFTEAVSNPSAKYAVMAIAPAMLFSCLMSVYRGYYEGLNNMFPTALSQVTEAVFKLLCGYGFAVFALNRGISQFETGSPVYGTEVSSLAEAKAVTLPFAAAAAILGVSVSTVFGFLFLIIRHKVKKDGITDEDILLSLPADRTGKLFGSLLKIAIPVSIGALVTNLTTLIDVSSLMQRISEAIESAPSTVYGMYEGLIPETVVYSGNLPNYLYGVYSSMAITIYNLVPAITTGVGISALPMITDSYTKRDKAATEKNIESVLRITAFIAIPAGLGLAAMSHPILSVMFSGRPMEVEIAAPLLTMMGFTVIFTALSTPLYNILQGIGKPYIPVWLMFIGGVMKLSVNYFLAAVPSVNIMGAPIGSLCCYGFIFFASVFILMKTTGISISMGKVFIKPLLSASLCALSAKVSYSLLDFSSFSTKIGGAVRLIISIGIGAIIYLIALFITKSIDKSDIFLLPKGKNILKVLEKLKII